ncbi:MAG TPA: TetR/AcrR family transcriptional regulator [Burkholderiales bacterium]|nr:TetR/AcrR family transcriptional regulator [Burkholderiales bacterium]
MERKPQRRTRSRILETSLRLFNDFGEPNVTTTLIVDEMNISPGNLYYHFRSKDEIVDTLFGEFEREVDGVLAAPTARTANVEDVWLFLHVLFEAMWRYRFLYRDLNDLLSRNRLLEVHFKRLLDQKTKTAAALCDALAAAGEMRASRAEIAALAVNMVVVLTYWLSFEYVRDPRHPREDATLARGAYQVMALVAPFLAGHSRSLFERLAAAYVA